MYALQRVLLGTGGRAFWGGVVFMILMIGVFASFSRAAWGASRGLGSRSILLVFFLEAHAREKVRMLLMALVGALMIVGGDRRAAEHPVGAAAVRGARHARRTMTRARPAASAGRAMRSSWRLPIRSGIGPLEFRNLRVKEEPHDTYVNVLHVYGWGGGLAVHPADRHDASGAASASWPRPRPTGCC